MDGNKSEEVPGKPAAEKPLPRGLDQVSHLFLSPRSQSTGPATETRLPPEAKETTPADAPLTVVLRPGEFHSREQLVSLIKRQSNSIEEGMKVIDANLPCAILGSIDLVALSSAGQITLIEIDERPNDGLLLRGISHFDWIVRNMAIVRRMYSGHSINYALQPRLLLMAPDFSWVFHCAARQCPSLQIHCFKYHAVGLLGGIGILFERVP
jgi:hypothetical protein